MNGVLLLKLSLFLFIVSGLFLQNEAKKRFIAFYSICGNDIQSSVPLQFTKEPITKPSQFAKEAIAIHLGIVYGMNKYKLDDKLEYEYYDVCNNTELLIDGLLNIILNTSSYSSEDNTKNDTNILSVFSYMTKSLTKLAADVLAGSNIPLVSFNNHSIPFSKISHPWFVEHGKLRVRDSSYHKDFVKKYNYDYVSMFYVGSGADNSTKYFEMYEAMKGAFKKDTCFVYEQLNLTTMNVGSIARRLKDQNIQLSIVIGEFINILRYMNSFHNIIAKGLLYHPIYEIPKVGIFHKDVTLKLKKILNESKSDHLFGHEYNITVGDFPYSYILIAMENYFYSIKKSSAEGTLSKEMLLSTFMPKTLDHYQRLPTKCTNFECPPGFERRVTKTSNAVWKNEYQYICYKCKESHFKTTTGSDKCQPCAGRNTSNVNRTECIVLYNPIKLDYMSLSTIIGFIINIFGLLLSLCTLLLFEVYRKTPVVRASDIYLSELQLITCIGLFLFFLVTVPMETTIELCVARPLFIGVFYTLFVAVTLAKAEKPLRVFLNRTKLTERDIKITLGHQYLVCMIVPVISIALFSISIKLIPPMVIVTKNDVTLTITKTCNTNSHVHFQLYFLVLLLISSLVQAYRSRRLPDKYSESMRIICSTFACCITLTAMIPIYYSQRNDVGDESKVHWITLSVVGVVLLLMLYGQKVVMIVFYPEKNTVKAFRKASTNRLMSQMPHSRLTEKPNIRLSVIGDEETSVFQSIC